MPLSELGRRRLATEKDATAMLHGTDIAHVLSSRGPTVKAVLLRHTRTDGKDEKPHLAATAGTALEAILSKNNNDKIKEVAGAQSDLSDDNDIDRTNHSKLELRQRVVLTELIEEVEVDTTPSSRHVHEILGGPFTFLGQYPSERTVVIGRRDLTMLLEDTNDDDYDDDDDDHDDDYDDDDDEDDSADKEDEGSAGKEDDGSTGKEDDDKQIANNDDSDKQIADKEDDDKQIVDKEDDDKQIADKEDDDKQIADKEDDDKQIAEQSCMSVEQQLSKLSFIQLQALCQEFCNEDTFASNSSVEKSDLITALLQAQLPINPHQLQPPLDSCVIRGDILIMRVAEVGDESDENEEDDEDDDVQYDNQQFVLAASERHDNTPDFYRENNIEKKVSNYSKLAENSKQNNTENAAIPLESATLSALSDVDENKVVVAEGETEADIDDEEVKSSGDEFFLDYSKEEYIAFASRTDVVAPELFDDDLDEDNVDSYNVMDYMLDEEEDEEEGKKIMLNLLLGEVLRQFREENGRGPNSSELLELRSQVAEKIGLQLPKPVDFVSDEVEEGNKKRSTDGENGSGHHQSNKRVKFSNDVLLKEVTSNDDDKEEAQGQYHGNDSTNTANVKNADDINEID